LSGDGRYFDEDTGSPTISNRRVNELAARIENCRKFILAGQAAVAGEVLFLSLIRTANVQRIRDSDI
jgi:hypothetical protein